MSDLNFRVNRVIENDSANFLHRQDGRATDEEDVPYEVGVAYYREIARGQISGHTDGRLEVAVPSPDAGTPWHPHFRGKTRRNFCTSVKRFFC